MTAPMVDYKIHWLKMMSVPESRAVVGRHDGINGRDRSGHGPLWLIDVFEKMGQDPDNDSYLKPGSDDVWAFVGDLKRWLTDANRKGIAT